MTIRTNLVSGVIFIVLGGVLLLLLPSQVVVADIIPFLESARAAPTLAIIVMMVGGGILVFQSLVMKKETVVEVSFSEQKYALYMIGSFVIYAGLIYGVGFIVASLALVTSLYFFYGIRNRVYLVVAIFISILVHFLFTNVFNVSLPGLGGALF